MKNVLRLLGQEYDLSTAKVIITLLNGNTTIEIQEYPVAVDDIPKKSDDELLSEIMVEPLQVDAKPEQKTGLPGLNLSMVDGEDVGKTKLSPDALRDQPSKMGIIPSGTASLVGTSRPLTEDEQQKLMRIRRDFEVRFVKAEVVQRMGYTVAKRGHTPLISQAVISKEFKFLDEETLTNAMVDLIGKEYLLADEIDRVNFVFGETPVKLLFKEIENEQQGVGLFDLRETVTVYKNPEDSKRSHPPNGKDEKK